MRYWFVLQKQNRKEVFADNNLLKLRNKKHNYKTSPHFEGAYISPIFDNTRPMPQMPVGIMGELFTEPRRRKAR
jgi:hypothetical protein